MDCASAGRVVERVDRWVEEATVDLWERFDSAWRERSRECELWERDWGSVVVRDKRGRVESRFK